MIMKTLIATSYFALLVLSANSQTTNIYTMKSTLKVVDEVGAVMSGVSVSIGYYTNSISTGVSGVTDTNGLFKFQDTSPSEYADYSFEAKKDGYYQIWQAVYLQSPYDPAKWNIDKTLVLKKVGKPVAMYAKHVLQLKFPEFNKAIGFDLMIGDWVGPCGKGVNADLLFTQHHTNPQSGYPITMSFPNIGDGIQEFTLQESDKGSGLRSGHEAPSEGYQTTIIQTEMTNPNRNFYFRVRTKLDESGKVVSARYGKIYGDLAQFTYYLNPTPNDRNIEFDPKQNLIHDLKSFERVTAP